MMGKFTKLTDSDLDRIYKKYVKDTHHVVCNKSHIHGFECVDFNDEQIMIIERLRVEVVLLRDKLKSIEGIINGR